MAPTLEEIAKERPDIKVVKINVDEEQELAKQFGILSIPALLVMKDGKIAQQSTPRPRSSPCSDSLIDHGRLTEVPAGAHGLFARLKFDKKQRKAIAKKRPIVYNIC